MRVRKFSLARLRDEEQGAVLAIVAISLLALLGMLVLTFDLGRGVAIKISDGNPRACPVAMAGVLKRLGFDHETLDAQVSSAVLGGGERVGEIRPCKETLAELGA